MTKPQSIYDLLQDCPKNQTITDNLIRAWAKINSPQYKKIVCTISGGSDSDVMLDIVWRCDKDNKVDYVWFDTGMEYEATKEHLIDLEEKYGIEIQERKAINPTPATCKQYGQPFVSKQVSEFIMRLQKHGFQWQEDGWKTYDALIQKYPHCQSALQWWCNEKGAKSHFNIAWNKYLKEYMIAYPPEFPISSKCCEFAKKKVLHKLLGEGYDLYIFGVRKSEGGVRATAYKNCFTEKDNGGCDSYRPLFFYRNSDKEEYIEAYCIENSRCYTEYGLKRTGCSGCPYGRDFEYELKVIERYEPKFYKAVMHIFGESYEYTRGYREFQKKMEEKQGESRKTC